MNYNLAATNTFSQWAFVYGIYLSVLALKEKMELGTVSPLYAAQTGLNNYTIDLI